MIGSGMRTALTCLFVMAVAPAQGEVTHALPVGADGGRGMAQETHRSAGAGPAGAQGPAATHGVWTPYLGLILRSAHLGNPNLNDATPGLTFGARRPGRRIGTEIFVEGGVFRNSYEEIAPILMAGTSTRLGALGATEIRAGISGGIAYYAELAQDLEARYGIPHLGGYLPVVAGSLALRMDGVDVRLTTVPPDTDTDAVFNLSVAFDF